VCSAQFSPDGKRIVTASSDNTARVWDAQSGQPLTEPLKHGGVVCSAQFSPDGKRIVTASLDNTAQVWDIAPSPTNYPAWLLQFAEVFSGQVLNKQGLLEPTRLDRAETIIQLRRRLNQKPDHEEWVLWGRWLLADPATRTISPFSKMSVQEYIENRIAGNTVASLAEAKRLALGNAELSERIERARKALELMLEQRRRASMLKQEALNLAAQGRWKEAAADYHKWVELAPEEFTSEDCFNFSALLVQSGDLDGYRQNCARALARFGGTKEYDDAQTVVQACLFLPSSSVDLTEIDRLAQTAAMCPPSHINFEMCQFAKGLTEYRQNHFSSAAEWIQKTSVVVRGDENTAQFWLVLAMAQYHLHQTNQARSSFANGFVIVEKLESDRVSNDWGSRIQTHLLAKEAKELIAGQTNDAGLSELIARARTALEQTSRADLLKDQAEASARAGRWKEAVRDCAKAIEALPDDDLLCYSLAALLVQSGDLEGYRLHCARALARFGSTQNPAVAGRLAKACLILPGSGVNLEAAARLAETAVSLGRSDPNFPAFQFSKGLAEYRQGRFAGAVEWEQKALATEPNDLRDAEAWMVLAMAQCQLKRTEEAHAALAKGGEIIDTKLPKLESGDIGRDWRNWIIAHTLLKEAKELIEGQTNVK
jgi:tetratricopeptide (TPR) repeat protein